MSRAVAATSGGHVNDGVALLIVLRGLVPSPEVDPASFEAAAGLGPRRSAGAGERYRAPRSGVTRRGILQQRASLAPGVDRPA